MPPAPHGKFLNPDVRARVIEALNVTANKQLAAKYAGIHEATLHDWLARGRRYQHWMETGGEGDMMAEKLWRKAGALFDNGAKQSAYAVLAELDTRSDRQPDLPYYEFLLEVERALSSIEIGLAMIVRRAGLGVRRDDGTYEVEPDADMALKMLRSIAPQRWSERRVVAEDTDAVDEDALVARKQEEAHALLAQVRERRNGAASNGSGG